MSEVQYVTKCCQAEIRQEPLSPVPPPPMAFLAIDPPEKWQGWRSVCTGCGREVGMTLDYGTLDLGLVTDEQLSKHNDFEVLG